ncbi:hypothetical protein D9M72_409890 [compost metagenome]
MLFSLSEDCLTACAAELSFGAAPASGFKSTPVLLGRRVFQSRVLRTCTRGAAPSWATSSAEVATSLTARKFPPNHGSIPAIVHSGSFAAFRALAVCSFRFSKVAVAASMSSLKTSSFSWGTD